ncbi:MAG: carbon-nitrogen hydrolase family protein [Nanoarchaeota archaeon]
MKIALVQMEVTQEQPEKNLQRILDLSRKAKEQGAKIVLFPEGCLTDYVENIDKFAEQVPGDVSCQAVWKLAEELEVYISFGLIEEDGTHRYITQVFLGPKGFIYKYRKTWLYATTDRIKSIRRHRNEPDDFDPGTGPEIFEIEGIQASCIICADTMAGRCLKLVKELKPQLVFYPNNRELWQPQEYWEKIAKAMEAPLLVTNRVGISWGEHCVGGSCVYSKEGKLLATANQEGKEETLIFDLDQLSCP